MAEEIEYLGLKYASLKALVRDLARDGVTYACVASRIKRGWELSRTLSEAAAKNSRRTIGIGDDNFNRLKDLAKRDGISYSAMIRRQDRGWSDEELLKGKVRVSRTVPERVPARRGLAITINGVSYENFQTAYDTISPKISINAARARMRYGWSPEEALEIVKRVDGRKLPGKGKALLINGRITSARAAAAEYSVSYSTVLDRLMRGASGEQAVGISKVAGNELSTRSVAVSSKSKKDKKVFEVDGEIYESISALASARGMDRKLVYNRIRDNGWSAERAVKEPITVSVEVNGVNYRSSMSAWDEIGETSFTVYNSRKTAGFSLSVCLGLEPLPPTHRYDFRGVSYSSLKEIALEVGMDSKLLASRTQRMSIEDAVSFTPMSSQGRYCDGVFRSNPELARIPGIMYFVKIDLPEGVLHKVGISQGRVEGRFVGQKFQPLAVVSGLLEEVYALEQLVLLEFVDSRYRANEAFAGKTETLQLTVEEELRLCNFILNASKSRNLSVSFCNL